MAAQNSAWALEEFIDSLVVELDKTRETLAVKAINKPLSYSVKELSLDVNAFPSYDGDAVRFVTAQPGQAGASKVTIQLGSITDQQVRATSNIPSSTADIPLEQVKVPKETKKTLRKLGISSVNDLKAIQKKNVDLRQVSESDIDYSDLANQIEKSRRGALPPAVNGVSLSMDEQSHPCLTVSGSNLAINPKFEPVAVMNGSLARVLSGSHDEIKVRLGPEHRLGDNNELILTIDPYAVVKLNVKARSWS